jgi:hypothetical protein
LGSVGPRGALVDLHHDGGHHRPQAMQKGLGWRKALRAAIADNPFVKGEGISPKARRELLGHSQLMLPL